MKRFIKKILIFALVLLVMPLLFCIAVDPFNVMHPLNIRDNGVEPNKNYIKMTYILENPDKFDSFMFGSSRVGNFHTENIEGYNCYNMTYSSGLPSEHLNNIRTLVSNGIRPRMILIGVDYYSYAINPETHLTEGLRCPYEISRDDPFSFWKLYLDPAVVGKALVEVISGHTPENNYSKVFYNYGWNAAYDLHTEFTFADAKAYPTGYSDIESAVGCIREIRDICIEYGIDLIVFTNPVNKPSYEMALENDYFSFLRSLSAVTPFYNFSGLNDITCDESNYLDTDHYSAEVSDLVLDCILKNEVDDRLSKQGFGFYVDNNIDELISIIES